MALQAEVAISILPRNNRENEKGPINPPEFPTTPVDDETSTAFYQGQDDMRPIPVRFPNDIVEWFDSYANSCKVSRSELVRLAMVEFVMRHAPQSGGCP